MALGQLEDEVSGAAASALPGSQGPSLTDDVRDRGVRDGATAAEGPNVGYALMPHRSSVQGERTRVINNFAGCKFATGRKPPPVGFI